MCGIRPCFALSGLLDLWATFTRGVAPAWFVVAPSGRWQTAGWLPRVSFVAFVTLFGCASVSFAANSPLADAVEKSDHSGIRVLLKQHAAVNAPQVDGMTALHWAAHLDDLET